MATSSTRRKAQLLAHNSGLNVPDIRGNVVTRMTKLAEKPELDATVLALAGLTRLNFSITRDGKLEGALFVGPAEAPPQWSDLRSMVGGPGIAESGPVICACFGVGVAAIHEALTSRKAANVHEIGIALRAGTKCGTCLPEIRSIVSHELNAHAHAHAH